MVRFTNKNDVLAWIKSHTSRRGVVRAIEESRVEYLGGFRFIHELNGSGWICRITSEYGRVWVVACGTAGTLKYLNTVPWTHYVGGVGGNSLYSGDNPKDYTGFRRLSYFEHKHKQRSPQDRAGKTSENHSTTNNTPLDAAKSVPMFTRFYVGFKNLWQRLF